MTEVEAAQRGRLEVTGRVVEKTVAQVSRELPMLDSAGKYPKASATMLDSAQGQRARVRLQVAAPWPCAAEQVADDVRRRVTDRARQLVGVELERVDVTLHVVTVERERVR